MWLIDGNKLDLINLIYLLFLKKQDLTELLNNIHILLLMMLDLHKIT